MPVAGAGRVHPSGRNDARLRQPRARRRRERRVIRVLETRSRAYPAPRMDRLRRVRSNDPWLPPPPWQRERAIRRHVRAPVGGPPLAPRSDLSQPLIRRITVDGFQTEAISATVHDWGKHQAPLVATFAANWLSRRNSSSCYLRLPTLVGPALSCVLAVTETAYGVPDSEVAPVGKGGPVCDPISEWSTDGRRVVNPSQVTIDASTSDPARQPRST